MPRDLDLYDGQRPTTAVGRLVDMCHVVECEPPVRYGADDAPTVAGR